MTADIYCSDASSLIDLNRHYKRSIFPGVWGKIEELAQEGRLIAPDEVRWEVERGDDELVPWVKKNRKMFRKLDQDQADVARDVIAHFPNLAKPGKFGPAADPFVVALAQVEDKRQSRSLLQQQFRCVVVTQEGRHGIPAACNHYSLIWVSLLGLFDREGWEFVGR